MRQRDAGSTALAFYAARHRHSDAGCWRRRLEAGQVLRRGVAIGPDAVLAAGDRLTWRRPPWQEEPVPDRWRVLHDDGDLHVIDKPAGLPVLPGGGFLEHTLLRALERRFPGAPPRPVHRLGRHTSGIQVCARTPEGRAHLSRLLRRETAGPSDSRSGCRKIYRALVAAGALEGSPGRTREVRCPIGRRPHPLLGEIWCAHPGGLPARSRVTLLGRGVGGDLVRVILFSGRPHQIRIHLAALGAPLLGDPLYRPGGQANAAARPGQGGYRLHAHRMLLAWPAAGDRLVLEAPLPRELRLVGAARGAVGHHSEALEGDQA